MQPGSAVICKCLVIVSLFCAGLVATVNLSAQDSQAVRVNFKPAVYRQAVRSIDFSGRLQPVASLPHPPPFAGIVTQVAVKVGQRVSEGQALYSVKRSDAANRDYAPATVYSRLSGVVVDIEIIANQDVATSATALVVADISRLRLETNASDKDVAYLNRGGKAHIALADGSSVAGVISRRSLMPGGTNALFTVAFEFIAQKGITLGQFVEVSIETEHRQAFLYPRSAVVRRLGNESMWVLQGDKAMLVPVKTGAGFGQEIEIKSGIAEGDKIIVTWSQPLRDGQTVVANPVRNASGGRPGQTGATGAGAAPASPTVQPAATPGQSDAAASPRPSGRSGRKPAES